MRNLVPAGKRSDSPEPVSRWAESEWKGTSVKAR